MRARGKESQKAKLVLVLVLVLLVIVPVSSCAPKPAEPPSALAPKEEPPGKTEPEKPREPMKTDDPAAHEEPSDFDVFPLGALFRSPQNEQFTVGTPGVKYGPAGWSGWGAISGDPTLKLDFWCVNPDEDGEMPGGKRAPRTTIIENQEQVTFRFDDVSWPVEPGEDIAVKAPYPGMYWDGARLLEIIRAEDYLELTFKVYGSYSYEVRDTDIEGGTHPREIGVTIAFSPVKFYPEGITVEHRISTALDLMLHIYAHIDMGANNATNYDPGYIEKIKQAKMNESSVYSDAALDLEKELAEISDWAKRDMRVVRLAFMSAYIEDPWNLIAGLRALAGQSDQMSRLSPTEQATVTGFSRMLNLSMNDKRLVGLLADIMYKEYTKFYSRHHSVMALDYDDRADAFRALMTEVGVAAIAPYMKEAGFHNLKVWLSEGRRVAGWGLSDGSKVGAVVPLPEEGEDGYRAYFTFVHEITHRLSDPIVLKATGLDPSKRDTAHGSEGYEAHRAVESGVILADYWIFKTYDEELRDKYLEWCRSYSISDPLLVPLDEALKQEIREAFSRR
ncbi:MAG: hypothetical protein ACOX5Q_04680 [Bacillota bacterium]|jgi:hypothetical protein